MNPGNDGYGVNEPGRGTETGIRDMEGIGAHRDRKEKKMNRN